MISTGNIIKILGAAVFLSVIVSSCRQEEIVHSTSLAGDDVSLNFVSDPMEQYKVSTRAVSGDIKDEDEKRINNLYIFFFGSDGQYLKGGYLTGYPDAPEDGGYCAPGKGVQSLKIDKNGFTNPSLAEKATVYAVANVEPALFSDNDKDGLPDNIGSLEDLEKLTYKPSLDVSLGLPVNGMPMVGHTTLDLTGKTGSEEDRTIRLEALMSRIDVNLKLASDITENSLPALTLVDWTAINIPDRVALTTSEVTGTNWSDTWTGSVTTPYQRTIYNKNGEISFSFYMFENRQNAEWVADDDENWHDKSQLNENGLYPPGIKDYQKQYYKPYLANKDAAALELHAFYSTYNEDGSGSATYEVRYTLYLGANHTDNFQVKRNHQYKNNITIKGLMQAGTNPDHVTFDARVNILDDNNDFYITILRERNHDAHFCVTPMDVYLFADTEKKPTMDVILGEIPEGSEEPVIGTIPEWIRMEKIPAVNMAEGTVPEGWDKNKYVEAKTYIDDEGNKYPDPTWHAGNGKRKYFTTKLLKTDLLSGTKVSIENSRDRIYFYLDENLSDSQDRSATVTLIYKENGIEVSRRTLTLGQTHFLPVTITEWYDWGILKDYYHTAPRTIYMEAYEEYLDHYDPLDEYQTEQIYTGLPWGLSGETISDIGVTRYVYWTELWTEREGNQNFTIPARENYYQGLEFTNQIIKGAGQSIRSLNQPPRSAAEYCYNKNKRSEDGTVATDCQKYFLPGIRQMEESFTKYYNDIAEFQNNFYWSSSAAKKGRNGTSQDENNARATKIDINGNYVASGEDDKYNEDTQTGGGNAPRTVSFRIRAFRIDLEPVDNE